MATTTQTVMLPELTTDELSRYSRHLILPEVGMDCLLYTSRCV